MFRYAIPVLHVADANAAERFYVGSLGFQQTFAYRPDKDLADPCYAGYSRGNVTLHVSSFSGDGVAGGVVYLCVDDIDELHRELQARKVSIDTPPVDQTWGIREMYVKDPDGNSIRFVQPIVGP